MLEDRPYMRRSPFETRRSATLMLVIANIFAFVVQCAYYGYPMRRMGGSDYLALSLGGLQHGYVWQLLTFQFMHAGFLHIFFNCWVIYVFGRAVEEALGRWPFLLLYFGSGIMGGLIQMLAGILLGGQFAGPVVGASAGGFGLTAAFAMLYPHQPLGIPLFFVNTIEIKARFLLLISVILAVIGIVWPTDNVAHAAHLGGILGGVLFVRCALQWNFHWPRFRRQTPPQRRRPLVRVSAGSSALWDRSKQAPAEELPPEEFLSKEVDPILDKISAHGIHSLTDRERRILEAARQKMGKR
jgi:membrane associated rhomboid family serine protease